MRHCYSNTLQAAGRLAACVLGCVVTLAAPADELFSGHGTQKSGSNVEEPILRSNTVDNFDEVLLNKLRDKSVTTLTMKMFDDGQSTYDVQITDVTEKATNNYVLAGNVTTADASEVFVSRVDNYIAVFMVINADQDTDDYQYYTAIYDGSSGKHRIDEIDVKTFSSEMEDEIEMGDSCDDFPSCTVKGTQPTGEVTVDILAVYTPGVATFRWPLQAIAETQINLDIYRSNLIYERSNSLARFNLVHFDEVNYSVDTFDTADQVLDELKAGDDGFGYAHYLRDKYAADIIVLYSLSAPSIGTGSVATGGWAPVGALASNATAWVKVVLNNALATFPHEVGHVLGAGHTGDPPGFASYAQGKWVAPLVQTLMTNGLGFPVPVLSNDDTTFGQLGIVGDQDHDNVRIINERVLTVASFREFPAKGMKFENSNGELVAQFNETGNIFVAGEIFPQATSQQLTPDNTENEFLIMDDSLVVLRLESSTGNLYLRGELNETVNSGMGSIGSSSFGTWEIRDQNNDRKVELLTDLSHNDYTLRIAGVAVENFNNF